MDNAARKQRIIERDPVDVALTIVPTEHDDPQPFVPRRRASRPSLVLVPPPAPTAPPAPARTHTGWALVGAVGGGAVLGGGLVGLLAAGGAALCTLAGTAGVAAWWVASSLG